MKKLTQATQPGKWQKHDRNPQLERTSGTFTSMLFATT
jgi:hypothetical protein